ncbi:ATP-binding protein [Streptomyces fulvoviolaceus]|uniref:ATP-binding protein n=1 Tax=Streptomyces fulvoviolaceus TaxID=285535 RepID=UPI0021BF3D1E|nr:ATP-binding protein [Streptomyces fulvoviolaceus]MCT9081347.1 ATP-binding protein [Streptomyces fulvoviolaceus]
MVHAPEEGYEPLRGNDPQVVERARDVARGFLSAIGPGIGGEAGTVLLVVSELVTNAVRHAGGVTGFRLASGPGTVTVIVEDASCSPPCPRVTGPAEPGGFGWQLVQDLSLDVQVQVRADGKTVSALVPLPN